MEPPSTQEPLRLGPALPDRDVAVLGGSSVPRLAFLGAVAALSLTACTASPPTALPILASEEVVVDDQDGSPAFTTTGDNWDTWSMPAGDGFDGGDTSYHYLTSYSGDGDRKGTATWSPDLPRAGTWSVSTWFRRTSNRSSDADHYLYDATGASTHVSVDQTGDGASGWVDLGDVTCEAGRGSCTVVVDGDDGQSDEANAVRFVFLGGDPVETSPCDEESTPGSHTMTWYAGDADGDGWDSVSRATGEADGNEATSENVDAGEDLTAWGWGVCDPPGDETLDRVVLGVKARMQYDSGKYALELALSGGGGASTVFSHTDLDWDTVDLTGDRASWTWADVEALKARLALHDHPGGYRDSDAWVDAFRVEVTFTHPDDPPPVDTGEPPVPDTGDPPTVETGATPDTGEPPGGDTAPDDTDGFGVPTPGDLADNEETCACAMSGPAASWLAWALVVVGLRRRPGSRSPGSDPIPARQRGSSRR